MGFIRIILKCELGILWGQSLVTLPQSLGSLTTDMSLTSHKNAKPSFKGPIEGWVYTRQWSSFVQSTGILISAQSLQNREPWTITCCLLFSCSVVSDSLPPHGLQYTRLPCPSPSPRACSNICPLSQWFHSVISSSVSPFSCLQSFPASGSFPMSQLFASGGQSIGASASVLPMKIQSGFPLGLTGYSDAFLHL